ncbi:MAG TPA: hypothetical protein [Caudoviricetes sp.]|nr:MAG TPA: hypothetical protein [Caudoviricetes sp.]
MIKFNLSVRFKNFTKCSCPRFCCISHCRINRI